MPLPEDEQVVSTSKALIAQFQAIFGKHPGFRPAHARGIMLTGTFTPSPTAATLSSAPHFTSSVPVPVTARFSSSTGIPQIPDTDPNANPRGFGVRFHLGGRKHTDIVAHSAPSFPTHTGAEFLEFLQALASGQAESFVPSHPTVLKYVQIPKPAPVSFANEEYFGVTAFKFINAEGKAVFTRYHIVPDEGLSTLSEEETKTKEPNFLFDELPTRIAKGPISFHIKVQIAGEGDVTDNATVDWPADRPVVDLGKLTLEKLVEHNEQEQKHIIYDPIPRVEGIEPSADPLLELRAAVYLLSGRERRAA